MKNVTRNMPALSLRAVFQPQSLDPAKRTVDLVWSTGARVLRTPWFDEPFYEELSLDPGHVRMDRLTSGAAPFLIDHNGYTVKAVMGVVESARLAGAEAVATVRFPQEGIDPEADMLFRKVQDSIVRNVSVGYRTYKFEKVEDGVSTTPVYRAVDWEPFEISAVPMGADAGAGTRAEKPDQDTHPCVFVTRGEQPHEESTAMNETEQKAAAQKAAEEKRQAELAATREAELKAESERGALAERQRIADIQKAVRAARLPEDFGEDLVRRGVSTHDARTAVLERLATESEQARTETHGSVVVTDDGTDKFTRGATAWLLDKSGVAETIRRGLDLAKRGDARARGLEGVELDPGEFRGMSLVDLARHSLERRGVKTSGMDKMKMVGLALTHRSSGMQTASDFGVLLENTMYKTLLGAYATTPDTWSKFCKVDTTQDFRPSNRYRAGSFGPLDDLTEAGEFKNKAIPDGEKTFITVGTKGNIIALSRQAIVNDDMGALADTAARFGRAARLTIEVDVYKLLAQNGGLGPTMADGQPFFHANRNNVNAAGSALGVAGLDADRVVMKEQKDPSDNEILDLAPTILLVASGLGATARVVNTAVYDPDATNKLQRPNPVVGLFRDIVDTARLSGTRRYLFADPGIAAAIVVAFLEGQGQVPFLEQQLGWRVDGTEWKCRLDFKAQVFDPRGAVTNAGA